MAVIRLEHGITDSKIKVNLNFDIVNEGVGDIMFISFAKPLPILSHGQILYLDLKLRDLEKVELEVSDVFHIEGLKDSDLGVDRMHILAVLAACKLLIFCVEKEFGVLVEEIHKAVILDYVDAIEHILKMLLHLLYVDDVQVELLALEQVGVATLINIDG